MLSAVWKHILGWLIEVPGFVSPGGRGGFSRDPIQVISLQVVRSGLLSPKLT